MRHALIIIPPDWQRRREILATEGKPGFAIVIAMGGNDGEKFAKETALHQLMQDTIIIYPDPVTFDGNAIKYNPGHAGQVAAVWSVDDVGMLASVLYQLTRQLRLGYQAVRAAMSPGGVQNNSAKIPRIVPEVQFVHDPNRIFALGYSSGALMAYRLGKETPLIPIEDPAASFRIRAIAVYAGSAGGHTETASVGIATELTVNVPGAGKVCSLLHIHGDDDDQVADEKFYTTYPTLTPVVTSTTYNALSYDGQPQRQSFSNIKNVLGYADATALSMTRWDFTVDASLKLWADAAVLGALPAYKYVDVDQLPYTPAAPVIVGKIWRWLELKGTTAPLYEPRVHAIRVPSANHGFPMSQPPAGAMGVPSPGVPWNSWNLAQYAANFFISFV